MFAHQDLHDLQRIVDEGGLKAKDHDGMAKCYHSDAKFTDIAFSLQGQKKIHAMWHMIAGTDLQISFRNIAADSNRGTADWKADYTFRDTGHRVHNELRSTFDFENGLIIRQHDECNALRWGIQALGPVKGIGSWLIPAKRKESAMKKIDAFIAKHPEYK